MHHGVRLRPVPACSAVGCGIVPHPTAEQAGLLAPDSGLSRAKHWQSLRPAGRVMARIRSLKPSIWTDEKFIALSMGARMLVIGMISHADDEGRLFASTAKLAGDIFPADELKPGVIRQWRDEAHGIKFLIVYQVRGVEYAYFPNWSKHQRISKPQPSILPTPPPRAESLPAESRNDSAVGCGIVPHPTAEQAGNDSAPDCDPRARAVGDRRQETGEKIPATPDAGKPRQRSKAEDPQRAKHAGDVVAAFVEGATGSGQPEPAQNLRARVGRDARQLLAEGYDAEALIKAAHTMGAGEWNDLAVQVRKDAATASGGGKKRGHQTYQDPADDSVYEEKI